jgi:hypothetical protein
MIWLLLTWFRSSGEITPTELPIIRRDGAVFGPILTIRRSL